jgi:hypothetical protein
LLDPDEDGHGRERAEPEGYKPEEDAGRDAYSFPNVADGSWSGKAEEIGWQDFYGLGAEGDESACSVSCVVCVKTYP